MFNPREEGLVLTSTRRSSTAGAGAGEADAADGGGGPCIFGAEAIETRKRLVPRPADAETGGCGGVGGWVDLA